MYPNLNRNPLVVIDGLVIEDNPAISFDRDSINTFVTKICPIIQENDIDYISYLDKITPLFSFYITSTLPLPCLY